MLQQNGFFYQSIPQYQTADLSASDIDNFDSEMGSFDFSSPLFAFEDFPEVVSSSFPICSSSFIQQAMLPIEHSFLNLQQVNKFSSFHDQFMVEEFDELCDWMECESSFSSEVITEEENNMGSLILSPSSSIEALIETPSVNSTWVLPYQNIETEADSQMKNLHLLFAYIEAKELKHEVLAEKILRRLREKASPTGTTLDRVVYYFIRALDDDQIEYLTQETSENYQTAYKVFYQMFPFGRFVHFSANKVILETIPKEVEVVHIIDFDIENGIQWPSLLEELERRGKRVVKLTAMEWDEEDCVFHNSQVQRFKETKRWLYGYAKSLGLRLKIDEMDMEGLVSEMKRLKKRVGSNEWLAFNCIVGLPHMKRGRCFKQVIEFIKLAKESIRTISDVGRGVITFGDGSGSIDFSSYGSFFEGKLREVLALVESIERHFPSQLEEARIAIESLFVAPYVSSSFAFKKWEETRDENMTLAELGLVAWDMSKDNLMEAKEGVREKESLYQVKVAERGNELVLGYMQTPLVRVSSWR